MTEILCVVEIPRGSRNKYEWSSEHGRFLLDRFLSSSVVFPVDYGFVPGTDGGDGDPLDVLIAVSEPTFTGCGVIAKPVAVRPGGARAQGRLRAVRGPQLGGRRRRRPARRAATRGDRALLRRLQAAR